MNYEKGADYCSYNWHFRILHKILKKLDPKKVVYSALLPVTDDSLTKNQRTTFVVFRQSARVGTKSSQVTLVRFSLDQIKEWNNSLMCSVVIYWSGGEHCR